MKPTKIIGRPPKPAGEKYVMWALRFPPEELEEFQRVVPASQRAEFARAAIRRAVREAAKRERIG